MRILVIGGSGYFGTSLNQRLSEQDFQIESLDAGFFRDCWLGNSVPVTENFLPAESITENLISKFDVVVMLAAISNDPLKQVSESDLYKPSEGYTEVIARMCKANNTRFIFASSCSVYGNQSEIADESSPVLPKTPYSANKVDIEKLLLSESADTWRPLILRFATIYGPSPRMRFDTVVNMFCGLGLAEKCIALNSNGKALRPFLYIEDAIKIVKWFISLGEKSFLEIAGKYPVFNVGSNESNISISELAWLVSKISGGIPIKSVKELDFENQVLEDRKIREGVDNRSYTVSFNKLSKILPADFSFFSLEEGIKLTLDFLSDQNLDRTQFYRKNYYRLQYLESLIDSNVLDTSLNYVK